MFLLCLFCKIVKNGSAWLNKMATRAKNLETTSPHRPVFQFQNNLAEMFLLYSCTKMAEMVSLC